MCCAMRHCFHSHWWGIGIGDETWLILSDWKHSPHRGLSAKGVLTDVEGPVSASRTNHFPSTELFTIHVLIRKPNNDASDSSTRQGGDGMSWGASYHFIHIFFLLYSPSSSPSPHYHHLRLHAPFLPLHAINVTRSEGGNVVDREGDTVTSTSTFTSTSTSSSCPTTFHPTCACHTLTLVQMICILLSLPSAIVHKEE